LELEAHRLREQILEQEHEQERNAREQAERSAITLRGLTHAIKNPLTIIETCSEHLAFLGRAEEDTMNNALQQIQDQVNQARQIVNQLLTATALPEFRVFDLKVELELLLHETLQKNPEWENKIQLCKQCELIPQISGDPEKLKRAFENFFINACQAMEDKGGALTLRLTSTDDTIRIEVQDTGCGIDPEELPNIFKPLYTTKKEKGGIGLGMWIAQQILEEHQGKIDIKSQPGAGATVRVELPIAPTARK